MMKGGKEILTSIRKDGGRLAVEPDIPDDHSRSDPRCSWEDPGRAELKGAGACPLCCSSWEVVARSFWQLKGTQP